MNITSISERGDHAPTGGTLAFWIKKLREGIGEEPVKG